MRCLAAVALGLMLAAPSAVAEIRIGLMVSATGPTPAIGIPQRNTGEILPRAIGPSTTPNALAILDVIAEAKVPLLATVGSSSVVEPLDAKRRWVFKTTQNDDPIASAPLGHMVKHGVHTVGFIGFSDPIGDGHFRLLPE